MFLFTGFYTEIKENSYFHIFRLYKFFGGTQERNYLFTKLHFPQYLKYARKESNDNP